MNKRSRTFQDPDVKSGGTQLKRPSKIGIRSKSRRGVDGVQHVNAGSVENMVIKPSRISFNTLAEIAFPRFSTYITCNGYATTSCGPVSAGVIQRHSIATSDSPAGTTRTLNCFVGKRGWYEFVSLPHINQYWDGTNVHVKRDVYGVDQLIAKARDIYQNTYSNLLSITPGLQDPGVPTFNTARAYTSQFCYEGGYQLHYFTNQSNTVAKITIYECCPRKPMPACRKPAEATTYAANDVLTYMMLDYQALNAQISAFSNLASPYIINDVNSTDGPDDKLFDINDRCVYTHQSWVISKPKTFRLDPGGKMTYKIVNRPFFLKDSIIDEMYYSSGGEGIYGYMPNTTKQLVVLVEGDTIAHTTKNATTGQYTGIGTTSIQISHYQSEYHSCRYIPYSAKNVCLKATYLDVASTLATNIDYVMDEEENAEEKMQ